MRRALGILCLAGPLQAGSVDLFGNALYWKTTETVDWAATISQFPNSEEIAYQTLSFDWAPGFRVGMGCSLEYGGWDAQFFYTRFTPETSGQATGTVSSAFLGSKVSLVGTYQTGTITLDLDFNLFDAELGCWFSAGEALFLRPLIGLKGGWINQKIHTEWEKPDIFFTLVSRENLKNNFAGAGPKIGVEGEWTLGTLRVHSFSLVGDFAGAFLWGRWIIQDRFQDNFFVTVYTDVATRHFGALMLQGFLGFRWDFAVDEGRSRFALTAGYELEDWLNQYQVFDNFTGGHNNDLLLQGLTADLRFDF